MSMRVNNLTVTCADKVLADVAGLTFESGRPVTIVGESGSGKSLLAHAIMGTLPANLTARGSLYMDSRTYDLEDRTNRRSLWGRTMSLLPQEPVLALDPTMRAREQVAEASLLLREHMLALLQESLRLTGQTLPGPLPAGETDDDPHTGVVEQGAP